MTNLQKVSLGTAPAGSDGDTTRVGFTKSNSNVDVLNTQAVLTSNAAVITTAQALTVAHVGKRVNINLSAAGTINLPAASTCGADNLIHLRNVGTTLVTLAITSGSGDTIALTTLAAGESAIMDTDGVHAWTCAMRGRSSSSNEVVQGNCAVVGNESVGGTLTVGGASSLAATSFSAGPTFGSVAAALSAFKNSAAGRVLVTGTSAGQSLAAGIQFLNWTTTLAQNATFNGQALTISAAGIYRCSCVIGFSGLAAGQTIELALFNGGTMLSRSRTTSATPGILPLILNFTVSMAAGTNLNWTINPTASCALVADATFNSFSIEQIG